MKKHRFKPEQIINFDEKGFLIRRIQISKRYLSRDSKISGVKYDGTREWISVKAAITADGRALSPGIIFQSTSQLVYKN